MTSDLAAEAAQRAMVAAAEYSDKQEMRVMSRILDSRLALSLPDVWVGDWTVHRCGYASRINPPIKRGRWWLWIGPYVIGRLDETW